MGPSQHSCPGMNQFNHMALSNAQISQAPLGARAASPMNHPQQMNLSAVPAVRMRQNTYIVLDSEIAALYSQPFILSPFYSSLNGKREDPSWL